MKHIILFLILLFNTSCGPSMNGLSPKATISYKLMQEFGKEMANEGYCITGVGLRAPNQKIESLNIGFRINEVLSFTTSRQHVVKLTQKFILKINAQKDLAQYLIISPITPENVEVSVSGLIPNETDENYVKQAFAYNGKIAYFDGTVEFPRVGFLKEESWEEAFNIVEKTKLSNN